MLPSNQFIRQVLVADIDYTGDNVLTMQFAMPYVSTAGEIAYTQTQSFGQIVNASTGSRQPPTADSFVCWQWCYRYLYMIALWADMMGGIGPTPSTEPTTVSGAGVIDFG